MAEILSDIREINLPLESHPVVWSVLKSAFVNALGKQDQLHEVARGKDTAQSFADLISSAQLKELQSIWINHFNQKLLESFSPSSKSSLESVRSALEVLANNRLSWNDLIQDVRDAAIDCIRSSLMCQNSLEVAARRRRLDEIKSLLDLMNACGCDARGIVGRIGMHAARPLPKHRGPKILEWSFSRS